MKKNETNATEVMKFFREQREAKQLKAMNYGGMIDPPTKVEAPEVKAPEVKTIGKVTPGGSTNGVGKPKGSYKQQVRRG